MRRNKRKTTKGGKGGVLFGGVFTAIGLAFLALSVIPTFYEGLQMRSWESVAATVLQTDINYHRGDKSTTYSVSVSYRYSWQGHEYTGKRVGIDSGSDNVGDWHQQLYQRLKYAHDNHRTVTVWVNPEAPDNAVIDRDIRWGLLGLKSIFAVVFAGVGFAIMFGFRKRATSGNSTTPWLANPAWRDNRIRSSGKGVVWILWLFGIVWALFMIPLWMNVDKLRTEGLPLSLLPYIFSLIGAAVLLQAAIKTLRQQRFGDAVLSLTPFPGDLNGRVAGQVELASRLNVQKEVEVRLTCLHVYWRRSGNKRERRTEVVWQDSRRVRMEHGPRGARINFDFRPQKGLPASSEGSDYHEWVVEVNAKLAGPDLDRRFTIPVFTSSSTQSETEEQFTTDASLHTNRAESVSADSLPDWLQMGYRAGGMALELPMFRNLTMAIPMLFFGAIFAGIGVFLLQQSDVPLVMGLIFTLVGGAIFLGSIYSMGNSLEVSVSPRGIDITRRVFGIPFHRAIAPGLIHGLDKKISGQAGNTGFYRVFVIDNRGGHITIADSLPSVSAADYLIAQLSQQLKPVGKASAKEIERLQTELQYQREKKIKRWGKVVGFILFAFFFSQMLMSFLKGMAYLK